MQPDAAAVEISLVFSGLCCIYQRDVKSFYRFKPVEVVNLWWFKYRFLSLLDETESFPSNPPLSLHEVVRRLVSAEAMKESPVAVCAIMGGVVSQLLVKFLTGEEMEDTAFEFDGMKGNGTLYAICFVFYIHLFSVKFIFNTSLFCSSYSFLFYE